MAESEDKLVSYRLDQIEAKLDRLIVQQEEAQTVRTKQAETLATILNDLNDLKVTAKDHEKRLCNCETEPAKAKAKWWETSLDYIFKGILGAVLVVVLAKIGLR